MIPYFLLTQKVYNQRVDRSEIDYKSASLIVESKAMIGLFKEIFDYYENMY